MQPKIIKNDNKNLEKLIDENSDNGNTNHEELYKKELTNFVVSDSSEYPEIKGYYSRKTRLEDIFNFLSNNTNTKYQKF